MTSDFKMIAVTFYGMEDILASELMRLGARDISKHNRSVSFVGDLGFMYKCNIALRTAIRILKPVFSFEANGENELYEGFKKYDWTSIMDINQSFAIDASLNSDTFTHSLYVSQKCKDAVVDLFRAKTGQRPNVNTESPEIRINVHIYNRQVNVSLDSSGDILFKRGYRTSGGEAPLNEVLAAGLIELTGWDGRTALLDGMCGSGTLATEAALFANRIPPGYFRSRFGFMNWKDYDTALFDTIYESCIQKITNHQPKITALEIDKRTYALAERNIKSAKVDDVVKVLNEDFFEYKPETSAGTIILNPPYGERLKNFNTQEFYKRIGDKLKKDFAGFTCWILTSSPSGMKSIGLRPSRKITIYNGSLECRFLRFDLYSGTKKVHKLKSDNRNNN
jgi:putative N6-adenine-specific DNA methylase